MYLFTSDLHFGHENVLLWREGFSSIDEMDKVLINNWNRKVRHGDSVIITGDLFYKNKRPVEDYLTQLNGKKILVQGNHDQSWLKNMTAEQINKYFIGVYDMHGMKKNGVKLKFCHYPMISWESSRHSSLLVCGHIHGKKEGFEYEMFCKVPMSFNAGVDVNNMEPVTLAELIDNNIDFYERSYTDGQIDTLRKIGKSFDA